MILVRLEFENIILGCCGLFRTDQIYPIGSQASFTNFKNEAIDIVKNYGNEDIDQNDICSIEYFEGTEIEQNFRLDGKSIYLLKRDCDGNWLYSENGELVFTVKTVDELRKKWQM